jgi:hypothetical protein
VAQHAREVLGVEHRVAERQRERVGHGLVEPTDLGAARHRVEGHRVEGQVGVAVVQGLPGLAGVLLQRAANGDELLVGDLQQARHAAEAPADGLGDGVVGLVPEVVLHLGPGVLDHRPHLDLEARLGGGAAAERAHVVERAVAEAPVVAEAELVGGVPVVHGEGPLDGAGDGLDGVFEVGGDAEPDEVGEVPEARVGAVGAGELVAQARDGFHAPRHVASARIRRASRRGCSPR